MDVDVELAGLQDLEDRLAHAQAGLVDLEGELAPQLLQATPPTLVFDSLRMRARAWGDGDVWMLPAGGWLARRVKLPDPTDALADRVQDLLDGS